MNAHTPRRGGEARAIGVVAGLAKPTKARRTFQPVRRNSYHRGEREARFWRPVHPAELDAIREAAKRHDLVTKAAGKRNGGLGHVALQVLDYLCRVVSWKDGTLEPAIETIMRACRRSRDAVVRGLKALRDHGFLEWLRRTEPIEDAEGAGPRVRQITNAYRILRPASWANRIAMRLAGVAARRAKAPNVPPQEPTSPPGEPSPKDPDLARVLARLGEAVARTEGESAERSESRPSALG